MVIKTIGYYRFIAPAILFKKGIPLTKENIEAEAQRLFEEQNKKSNI